MVIIEESGMRFGSYSEDDVFHIERSHQYRDKLMPNGVKCCEFILSRGDALIFVEAKTSCPDLSSSGTSAERIKKHEEDIEEIVLKMRHAISLYASILLKRQDSEQVPPNLLNYDLSGKKIKLVLVVKNAEKEWLSPLRDKIDRALKKDTRIWKCDQLLVINEEQARRKSLVI